MSLKDFQVISKLGTSFRFLTVTGDGAYSVVNKVKRTSDGKIYALKKVRKSSACPAISNDFFSG